jgi:hypothetical protein
MGPASTLDTPAMLKTSPMQISVRIIKDFLVIVGPPFVIRIENIQLYPMQRSLLHPLPDQDNFRTYFLAI